MKPRYILHPGLVFSQAVTNDRRFLRDWAESGNE